MPGAATFQVLFLATGREKSNHADRYLISFELLADAKARHYLTQSDARANFLKASSSSSSSFAKNVSSVGCEKKNFAKKCRRPSPKIEPLPDLRLQVDRLALTRVPYYKQLAALHIKHTSSNKAIFNLFLIVNLHQQIVVFT